MVASCPHDGCPGGATKPPLAETCFNILLMHNFIQLSREGDVVHANKANEGHHEMAMSSPYPVVAGLPYPGLPGGSAYGEPGKITLSFHLFFLSLTAPVDSIVDCERDYGEM